MATAKTYNETIKRSALALWVLLGACMLGALILPFYWFWEKIAARTDTLAIIVGLLLWAMWNWCKLVVHVSKGIRNLPEPPTA